MDGQRKQIFHPDQSDSRDLCGFEWETRYTWEPWKCKKKAKNAFNGHRLLANLKRICETNISILINNNSTKYENRFWIQSRTKIMATFIFSIF